MLPITGTVKGNTVILDDDAVLNDGEKVIITVINPDGYRDRTARKTPKNIDISKYIGVGQKICEGDAQDYIRESRDCDRFE